MWVQGLSSVMSDTADTAMRAVSVPPPSPTKPANTYKRRHWQLHIDMCAMRRWTPEVCNTHQWCSLMRPRGRNINPNPKTQPQGKRVVLRLVASHSYCKESSSYERLTAVRLSLFKKVCSTRWMH
jgi:hypothetical protein